MCRAILIKCPECNFQRMRKWKWNILPDIGFHESGNLQPCFPAFEAGEENRTKYEFALIRNYSPRYDKGHISKKTNGRKFWNYFSRISSSSSKLSHLIYPKPVVCFQKKWSSQSLGNRSIKWYPEHFEMCLQVMALSSVSFLLFFDNPCLLSGGNMHLCS